MENLVCPHYKKCPIFNKNVFFNEKTGETYKNYFCLIGEKAYKTCKRYQVTQKGLDNIPEHYMPNSSLTVDEIIQEIKKHNL